MIKSRSTEIGVKVKINFPISTLFYKARSNCLNGKFQSCKIICAQFVWLEPINDSKYTYIYIYIYGIYFVRLKFLFIINFIISNLISADGILNFKFVDTNLGRIKKKKKKMTAR